MFLVDGHGCQNPLNSLCGAAKLGSNTHGCVEVKHEGALYTRKEGDDGKTSVGRTAASRWLERHKRASRLLQPRHFLRRRKPLYWATARTPSLGSLPRDETVHESKLTRSGDAEGPLEKERGHRRDGWRYFEKPSRRCVGVRPQLTHTPPGAHRRVPPPPLRLPGGPVSSGATVKPSLSNMAPGKYAHLTSYLTIFNPIAWQKTPVYMYLSYINARSRFSVNTFLWNKR